LAQSRQRCREVERVIGLRDRTVRRLRRS
jgi:hypothetical protein